MKTKHLFRGAFAYLLLASPMSACGSDDKVDDKDNGSVPDDTGSGSEDTADSIPGDTGTQESDTQSETQKQESSTDSETESLDTGTNTDVPELPDAPFLQVGVYETTLSNKDVTDVYYPNPSDLMTGSYSFPVALMLQGAYVDKKYYKQFATTLASWGFVVVVPNHQSKVMPGTTGKNFIDLSVINAALDHMKAENDGAESPVRGALDTTKLILLGHSHGGQCGLNAIIGKCQLPCCSGGFARPDEIVAGAFWGTSTIGGVNNEGVPVALIYGTKDGMAKPATIKSTYNALQHSPKALISIEGANHYGECDVNNPPGALKDSNKPDLDQEVSSEAVGRWSGWFLRAHVLGDDEAFGYVYETGSAMDPVGNLEQSQTE